MANKQLTLAGVMVETYIINEIIKSYKNNHKDIETSFYYYRTYDKDEIDLVILHDGKISLIECKSGETYNKADANKFCKFAKTKFILDKKAIICTTHILYSLGDECFVLPINAIQNIFLYINFVMTKWITFVLKLCILEW